MTEWDPWDKEGLNWLMDSCKIGWRFQTDQPVRRRFIKLTVTWRVQSVDVYWQVVNIYWACHVSISEWPLYRIEASLRLPCISHIYIRCLTPIFTIFNQKSTVRAKPSTLLEHSIVDEYLPITTIVTHHPPSVVSIYFNTIIKLHFRPCIVVRLTIPVNDFKPVSLRFYRQL